MTSAPLNIFQRLMRRWEAVHPYNAAQVMKLTGTPDLDAWNNAWRNTLFLSGIGRVALRGNRYHFEELNGHLAALAVRTPEADLESFLSAEINRPFADAHEPPFRPFIIKKDGFFYAGLIYQHWLADSCSIRSLIREWFVRVYDPANANAEPIELASAGYWKALARGFSGFRLSKGLFDLGRRHIRMRKVQKIDSNALAEYDTAFRLIPVESGLIDRLRIAAHSKSMKINDIFLAALVQACARHVPLQPRKTRHDVAVGSVVDLRPWCRGESKKSFGLYLGFTNVVCTPTDLVDFNHILKSVSRQTRLQKEAGIVPISLMWMTGALWVGRFSKPSDLYHFYRKELPLAGGLSNVDLSRSWPASYHPALLLDYIRVSPTGPMAPLAVTTTTVGDQFNIGITHRKGLIPTELADQIGRTFVSTLNHALDGALSSHIDSEIKCERRTSNVELRMSK